MVNLATSSADLSDSNCVTKDELSPFSRLTRWLLCSSSTVPVDQIINQAATREKG